MNSLDACVQADLADPLRGFKDQFALPAGKIYLDGNSLGAMPKTALACGQQVIEQEWGTHLISSWTQAGWFDLPVRLGDKLSTLLGGHAGELVVCDTTSLNLFKAMGAALRIQQQAHPVRKVILSERSNFPTDLYMIEGMIDLLQQGYSLRLIEEGESVIAALDDSVAVVVLSHVNYRTGAMHDLTALTARAHDHGALIVWDLCHSSGAVPVDLSASGADFAVGCTYKYLNGGPGAPAFIWVATAHQDRFWQPLSGWWGHATPFAMESRYAPAQGIRRFLCGTQPIISLRVLECGLDIALQADMQAVHAKSLALTDLFISLVEHRCAGHSLTLITPREHAHRGSHVSFRHPEGYALVQALIARGVIGDYREPEVMRFGITPLYAGFADVWNAVETLRDILDTRAWDRPEFRHKGAVT